ncbi:hypothetical protein DRO64_09710 [Candidatus Bathyarchaeota archaeon]|nr:MAG: hypothetical protein DRO64_09710 [Candidatus Bathyarchaeota archaeon]
MSKIYIAVEDAYAPRALWIIVNNLRIAKKNIVIDHLLPCSTKMRRIINAAFLSYDKIIVIADAERKDPEKVKRKIKQKCLAGKRNGHVIITRPCIEEWPCKVLGLKGCNQDPVRAINNYWMKKRGNRYRKALLGRIFEEAFEKSAPFSSIKNFPDSLREFIKILKSKDH